MTDLSDKTPGEILNDLELEKKRLEIGKLKVETEKLEIEKKQLKTYWFLKPQWWSILVPLLIGAGTILIAFLTGIISVERLKNEKEDLTKTINIQKDSLSYYLRNTQLQKDSMLNLIKLEQVNINKLRGMSDSLSIADKNKANLIKLKMKEKLNNIERDIYMYEDHDSIYRQMDALLGDTTSHIKREIKLKELRKVREDIKRQYNL